MRIKKRQFTWWCILALLFNSCNSSIEKVSDNLEYYLVVDKSKHTLEVMKPANGKIEKSYKVTTGRRNGDKQYEGDCRTPVGRYHVRKVMSNDPDDRHYDTYLVSLNNRYNYYQKMNGRPLGYNSYGPKAFVLNYPNKNDKKKGKSGSGIWIHGTSDPASVGKNTSNGCIRMHNSDLLELAQYVNVGTKVLIKE